MSGLFSHRMIVTNENGGSVGSEIVTNSLSNRTQQRYIEEHFALLNIALGLPPRSTFSYNTSDPVEADKINTIIKKIMNGTLNQGK